jgi:tRNA-Thr(GGU) m(6)t(6)A37 methyltransferase TsaA
MLQRMGAADGPDISFSVKPIGVVRSELVDPAEAPKQGDEGAPEAIVTVGSDYAPSLEETAAGDEVILLTWFHLADRDVQTVHPRGDRSRPPAGVFATRSPDRPNPIGMHRVTVLAVEGNELRVSGLEAIDGTPVLDIKPVLSADAGER